MLAIGVLSILQIAFLPGFLALYCLDVRIPHFLQRLVYAFAASLVVNFALVFALVSIGLYTQPVVVTVIIFEACAALWIWRKQHWALVSTAATPSDLNAPPAGPALYFFAILAALATLVVFAKLLGDNWGTVFRHNDDVASWDRWASDWAGNAFPKVTNWYPQLVPANWSLSYVLLGTTDIKMFAKAIMPAFSVAPMLLLLDAGWRKRDSGLILAVPFLGLVLLHYLGEALILSGYVETALAFFAFLPLFAAMVDPIEDVPGRTLLVLLFGAGCALTKQGGLPVFIAAAVSAVWMFRNARLQFARPARIGCVFAFALVLLWYGMKVFQVETGSDSSNLGLLTQGLHAGRSVSARFSNAVDMIRAVRGVSGPFMFWMFATLVAAGLAFRQSRWLSVITLSYFCGWAFLFSYEVRTLSVIFVYAAVASGIAVHRIVIAASLALGKVVPSRLTDSRVLALIACTASACLGIWLKANWQDAGTQSLLNDEWLRWLRLEFGPPLFYCALCGLVILSFRDPENLTFRWNWMPASAIAIVLVTVLSQTSYRDDQIRTAQLALQREIGSPQVNAKLYALNETTPITGEILTDYWFLRSLPGLKGHFRTLYCSAPCTAERLIQLASGEKSVSYVLIADPALAPGALPVLESRGFTTLFTADSMRFLQIDRSALSRVAVAAQ